jgi:ADP-heptose:LPS heptosyltransferase
MGLGGYLCWTTVAREIRKKYGDNIKLMPVEQHGSFFRFIGKDIDIFKNNNDFCISYNEGALNNWQILPLILNNPIANYCKKDTPQKAFHRTDKHIIEQYCEIYGINNPDLRCYIPQDAYEPDLWFKEIINEWFGTHSGKTPQPFITIEPNSNLDYTPNRSYSFEKWQKIVNDLKDKIPIVQIGIEGSKILDNVIDWTGKTSFCNTARMIGYSSLFLSSEGGLVHAATAFNTKSLVIITGYQSEKMVAYPQNININISSHGPCGLKIDCKECKKDIEDHDWKRIVSLIEKELCL